ncbi:hypothetical protein Lser_V15G34227 [Lactuca serriola]
MMASHIIWKSVDMEILKSLPPDSPEQQEYITAIQNEDGYNWGYDPIVQLTASRKFEESLALFKLLAPEDSNLRASK